MGGGMDETNWMPPLLVLGIGLILGIFFALRLARGKQAAALQQRAAESDDVVLRDLRVRRDQLIVRLREIDDTAARRTPEQLAQDRWTLELQAAEVLRDLDAAEAKARKASTTAAAAAAAAIPAAAPASSPWVGALWGGGVVLFGAILFFTLQGDSSDRLPGGSLTGNGPTVTGQPAGTQMPQQPDPELDLLIARAAAAPRDLEAQLDLAQGFMVRERLIDVFQLVQQIRAIDSENPRALTYEAVVRQAMGLGDQAMQLLDTAVAKDPQMAEAWVRRGLVAFDLERYDAAVESWEKALLLRPDGKDALAPVIAEAKLRREGQGKVAKAPPMGPATAPAAAAAAHPMPAAAPVAAAPAAAPGDLQIVLELDPALVGTIAPGTPLFVSVRPAGVKAGPPAAAKRLQVGSFPLRVAIAPGDTMMGQPLPNPAFIEARIDADGNAMTRSPTDPTGSADGVAAGRETRIVLRAGN